MREAHEHYTSVRQYCKVLSNRLMHLEELMWEAAHLARGKGCEDEPTYEYQWSQRWVDEFRETIEGLDEDILKLINRQYDDPLDIAIVQSDEACQ